MFSFGAKKANPPRAKAKPQTNFLESLNFHLDDFSVGTQDEEGISDDDADLEAELAALTGSRNVKGTQSVKNPASGRVKQTIEENHINLDDGRSDSECSSVDDAEVEAELEEICGTGDEITCDNAEQSVDARKDSNFPIPSILEERLKMYMDAKTIAQEKGEGAKIRRLERGIKTIKDLLKQETSGKAISTDDIPPALHISIANPAPSQAETNENPPLLLQSGEEQRMKLEQPPTSVSVMVPPNLDLAAIDVMPQAENKSLDSDYQKLLLKRQEYKKKALALKDEGNRSSAYQYLILVKVCDHMIKDAQGGTPIDWSQLNIDLPNGPATTTENLLATSSAAPEKHTVMPSVESSVNSLNRSEEPQLSVINQQIEVPMPRTTLEALEQRLAKYQSTLSEAQDTGNTSKQRRIGRIVKQYQDAVRSCKAGKPVPFDELPDPPGFPPIPGAPNKVESVETVVNHGAAGEPTSNDAHARQLPEPNVSVPSQAVKATAGTSSATSKPKTALQSQQDKQLAMMMERQAMFKQAALKAKKSGDITQAREYLRLAKGFDPLIEANQSGIRVDTQTLPVPPQLKQELRRGGDQVNEDGFVDLSFEPSAFALSATGSTHLDLLLEEQKKKCIHFRDYHKELGDVANANRFDQMLLATLNDIQKVRNLTLRGVTPSWTVEIKTFSIVKFHSDLKADEMEIQVVRGLSFNVPNPKTVDTYVKFEVPLPSTDNVTKFKTSTVKDTNCPEFNEKFLVNFARQSRTAQRIFKSKAVKFELYSKGGFLRSDVLLGTATLKLADLLNHCKIHEALDLMEGRKAVGGKIEVIARLREPLTAKETERLQEKWVVLE